MMACYSVSDRQNILTLDLKKLPPLPVPAHLQTDADRVQHLKSLLEQFGSGHPPAVKLPSVFDLAAFYHCDILNLLDTLGQFREQRYDYLMKSLDLPLTLFDPLSRLRRSRRSLHKASNAIRKHRPPLFPNYPV